MLVWLYAHPRNESENQQRSSYDDGYSVDGENAQILKGDKKTKKTTNTAIKFELTFSLKNPFCFLHLSKSREPKKKLVKLEKTNFLQIMHCTKWDQFIHNV